MRLIKCKNGHVYDADKLASCPHCPGILRNIDHEIDTFGENQENVVTEITDITNGSDNGMDSLKFRKNVAVLVMIEGSLPGRAYLIYEGTNRIGRSENYEVPLVHEDTVSRDGHAVLEYDSGKFYIYQVSENRPIYLNDQEVRQKTEIHDRDCIILGECKLAFVSYEGIYHKNETLVPGTDVSKMQK